jgi:hypothetical protein
MNVDLVGRTLGISLYCQLISSLTRFGIPMVSFVERFDVLVFLILACHNINKQVFQNKVYFTIRS